MMKNRQMAQRWRGYGLTLLLATGSFFATGRVQAATDSQQLTFKYTVVQGTCEIDVGNGGVVKLNDIVPPPSPKVYIGSSGFTDKGEGTSEPFDVKLTKCSGADSGTGGPTPGLRIKGTHDFPAGVTPTKTDLSVLFRDSTSTSEGLGFVIYTDAQATFQGGGSYVSDVNGTDSHKVIPIPDIASGSGVALNGDKTFQLYTNVSTGASTGKMKAGTLIATITFIFDYY